jgi:indole-3-glycerol phosphate synthase
MKAEAQVPGVLAGLIREAERRVALARAGQAELQRRAAKAAAPRDFGRALTSGRSVAVIAEIKRRSPSAGELWGGRSGDVAGLARALAEGGASALSVLTEAAHFGGSLDDLARAAAAVELPVLRKDFIIDPVQLYEARAYGAAAILLIARVLPPDRLHRLAELARQIGLASLVEVHGDAELPSAIGARPTAIGVNARDLDSLAMDRGPVERLLPRIPPDYAAVAESGLASRADVERVAWHGADAVLVGAAISGAPDPAAALRALGDVPRRAEGRGRA